MRASNRHHETASPDDEGSDGPRVIAGVLLACSLSLPFWLGFCSVLAGSLR